MFILPLKEFPLMARYKKVFPAINEHSVFAYDGHIYADDDLPPDLVIHEKTHLRQQEKMGLENWVNMYLTYPQFRLDVEVEAYRAQLRSISDRNKRDYIRRNCSRVLASELYGNIINASEAFNLLK